MTSIQVADQTFVAAAPSSAAEVIGDRRAWRRWWPELVLEVTEDRGPEGVRWRVTGPATGTMEIWCEALMDGFVLHYFLHAEPSAEAPADLSPAAWTHRYRVAGKVMAFEVKDRLESGREVGEPAIAADGMP